MSTLDLIKGYWQMALTQEAKAKMAFSTTATGSTRYSPSAAMGLQQLSRG